MIRTLYRDANWIAVVKPTGIPTTAPRSAGVRSLVDLLSDELAAAGAAGAVLHPLSRLDVEVTGVVLFALTHDAIAVGRRARERGEYHRTYVALLAAAPVPPAGDWTWSIGVDPRDPKRRVADGGRDAQSACTHYQLVGNGAVARVVFKLETGRTHQIRVHSAHAGCPVMGDRVYGGPRHLTLATGATLTARRVMLHAWRVVIPSAGREIREDPPEDFESLWAAAQG